MSRTSRRASRPLIAVVAIVIALGVFFTVHKIKKSSAAAEAKAAAAAAESSAPAPSAPAATPDVKPALAIANKPAAPAAAAGPTTVPSSPEAKVPAASEFDGLVTQTPTAREPAPTAASSPDKSSAVASASIPTTPATRPSRDPWAALDSGNAETDSPKDKSAAEFAAPSTDVSTRSIADAKSKADAGDPLASRQLLNEALISGRMADSDADAAKKQIDEINKAVVFSAKKFPEDPWGGIYQVASGERLATIALKHSLSWEFLSRVNGVTPKRLRSGQNIKVFKGPFHAVVYKHLFKMEIYMGAPGGPGSMYVTSFPVGLGKDNSTPTGLWACKAGDKIRNPRYYPPRGGEIIEPNDPKNPLGGYWIALEGLDGQAVGKESYGIHGTIDPNSIGKMESMGCIRLKADDISWVFDILVDGKSKVLVKD